MRIRSVLAAAALTATAPFAHAFTITPHFVDGDTQTWDATKIAVVNEAISEWTSQLSYVNPNQNIDMTFDFAHAGNSYLGQWHGSFTGVPTGTSLDPWSTQYVTHTVDFNADLMVPRLPAGGNNGANDVTLLFTQGPITSANWDALSVIRHELGHALGFSQLYVDSAGNGPANHYADHVSSATFDVTPGGLNVPLAAANNITHIADSNDLMNPTLFNGVRRFIGITDLQVLADAEGYAVTVPDAVSYTTNALKQTSGLTVNGTLALSTTAATRQTASILGSVGSLTLGPSGKLDLANHDLLIRGGQTLATLNNLITLGHGGSAGITSSTAAADGVTLGYATAGNLGIGTFDQTPVNPSDIIVKYTYAGDANFDGQVTIADLNALAAHWQLPAADWSQGDFNGDGMVTIADLNALAANWQKGVTGGSTQFLMPAFSDVLDSTSVVAPGDDQQALSFAVPEPTSLATLGLLAPLLLRRRRLA